MVLEDTETETEMGEMGETREAVEAPASAWTLDTHDDKEGDGDGGGDDDRRRTEPVFSNTPSNTREHEQTGTGIGTGVLAWLVSVPKLQQRRRPQRNYEAFRASNYVYFLGGRLRTSLYCPISYAWIQLPVLPITLTVLVLPVVFFLIFEAPWFWHNVSPAVVILFAYCWLQMFVNGLKAAFLDPGALPKNVHVTDGLEKDGLPQEYHNWIELPGPPQAGTTRPPRSVYMKYCDTCYIWRPVRASHCSKCGVCVANLDHHCPWLGNCVGQRNYWYFFIFLAFAVATSIYLLTMSFYKLSRTGLSTSRWSLFLGIYASCCLPYSLLLLVFHVCLGLTGITTREYFGAERHEGKTQIQDVCLDPFNSGSRLRNVRRQWFHGRGRANVEFRGRYAGNDLRFKEIHVGSLTV